MNLMQPLSATHPECRGDSKLSDILRELRLSVDNIKDCHEVSNNLTKVDINGCISSMVSDKLVADTLGSSCVPKDSHILFSTFVSLQPKSYLKNYAEIIRRLSCVVFGKKFIVIEDVLPLELRKIQSVNYAQNLLAYQQIFGHDCEIIYTSMIGDISIPTKFTETYLNNLFVSDVLKVLPYHRRKVEFLNLSDIIHFSRMLWVCTQFGNIILSGQNQSEISRILKKVCPEKISILSPEFPE